MIVASSYTGAGVACSSDGSVSLTCCDLFGNEGGDWVGDIADQASINGNISDDPLFCDLDSDDLHLMPSSPCAPVNSAGCGLIGAMDVGCGPIAVGPMSWSAIKGRYRCQFYDDGWKTLDGKELQGGRLVRNIPARPKRRR